MSRRGRALVALLTVAAACSPPAPPAAVGFRDPSGAPVTIDSLPAARIVSTLQSATEWIVALGAADHLVARTDFDREPALADLPSIGGGLEVSPEALVALHPDVVIGWRIAASAALARTLAPFHIPVVALEATDTAQAFAQLAAVGRLVGREDSARALAQHIHARLAALAAGSCPAGREPESVVLVLSTEPPITAGPGTWMSELLGAACLTNAFRDVSQPWPQVSIEAIVARRPRWILTSTGAAPGARQQELLRLPGWKSLEAVRAGRIIEIPPDLLTRSGPEMPEWVEAVITARHRLEPGG